MVARVVLFSLLCVSLPSQSMQQDTIHSFPSDTFTCPLPSCRLACASCFACFKHLVFDHQGATYTCVYCSNFQTADIVELFDHQTFCSAQKITAPATQVFCGLNQPTCCRVSALPSQSGYFANPQPISEPTSFDQPISSDFFYWQESTEDPTLYPFFEPDCPKAINPYSLPVPPHAKVNKKDFLAIPFNYEGKSTDPYAKSYVCPKSECGQSFRRIKEFDNHFQRQHPDCILLCDFCRKYKTKSLGGLICHECHCKKHTQHP